MFTKLRREVATMAGEYLHGMETLRGPLMPARKNWFWRLIDWLSA
jgi:hypothetical protein